MGEVVIPSVELRKHFRYRLSRLSKSIAVDMPHPFLGNSVSIFMRPIP